MNKPVIYILFTGFLLSLLVTSCEDIIDVDLRSVDPELVIEGVVRLDAPAEVLITKTKDFSSTNDYTPITDAVVVISDNDGNSEQLQPNASGRFMAASIIGKVRKTYHLSVTYENKEYTATSTMPAVVEIDSLTQWKFPLLDFEEPMLHFNDPLGEENQYYRIVIGLNGEWPNFRKRLISTEFMDGNVIHQPIFIRLEGDNEEDPIASGDLITIEMQCMDKGTFTFFDTLDRVEDSLANPTSNIAGGALGYFGAYSFARKDILMEW